MRAHFERRGQEQIGSKKQGNSKQATQARRHVCREARKQAKEPPIKQGDILRQYCQVCDVQTLAAAVHEACDLVRRDCGKPGAWWSRQLLWQQQQRKGD